MKRTKKSISLTLSVLLLAASACNLASNTFARVDRTAYLFGCIPATPESAEELPQTELRLLSEEGNNILLGAIDGSIMIDLSDEGLDEETIGITIDEDDQEWVTTNYNNNYLEIMSFLTAIETETTELEIFRALPASVVPEEEKQEPAPEEADSLPEGEQPAPEVLPENTEASENVIDDPVGQAGSEGATAEPENIGSADAEQPPAGLPTEETAAPMQEESKDEPVPPAENEEQPAGDAPTETPEDITPIEDDPADQEEVEDISAGPESNDNTSPAEEVTQEDPNSGENPGGEPPEDGTEPGEPTGSGAADEEAPSGGTSQSYTVVETTDVTSLRPDVIRIHFSACTKGDAPKEVRADFILTQTCEGEFTVGPESFYHPSVPILATADESGATFSGLPAMTLCTVGGESCYIYREDTAVTLFPDETAIFRLPEMREATEELLLGPYALTYLPAPSESAAEPTFLDSAGMMLPAPYDWADWSDMLTQTICIERLALNENGELIWTADDASFRLEDGDTFQNVLLAPDGAEPGTFRVEIAWTEAETDEALGHLTIPFYVFYPQ